jgi:hypothetical protein
LSTADRRYYKKQRQDQDLSHGCYFEVYNKVIIIENSSLKLFSKILTA